MSTSTDRKPRKSRAIVAPKSENALALLREALKAELRAELETEIREELRDEISEENRIEIENLREALVEAQENAASAESAQDEAEEKAEEVETDLGELLRDAVDLLVGERDLVWRIDSARFIARARGRGYDLLDSHRETIFEGRAA